VIDEVSQAAATLRGLANGLRMSQALYVAAELRVADHLSEQPLDSSELAAVTGADAAALGRVLRALSAFGVFSVSPSGRYSLNSVGRLLRSDVPGSWRAGVLFMAGPVRWRCWSQLLETVRTGLNASERVLGRQLFEFYATDAVQSKIHDDAMRSFSASHAAAIVAAIDLRQARLVIDVGGGTGELLAAILAANPDLRGVVFDLPDVADHAVPVLAARHVADRCTIERGTFFESMPGHGDVYLLKHVIHDWDDERATDILRCCRRCMPPNAKLMLVERKLPELADCDGPAETFTTDLEMLVMSPGGRERTESEFRKLLGDAGFEYLRTLPTASPSFVFEAQPASPSLASPGSAPRN
jgi:O-methyltransferase/methyltransferase family protein